MADAEAFARLEAALGGPAVGTSMPVARHRSAQRAIPLEALLAQLEQAESRLERDAVVETGEQILEFDVTDQGILSRIAVGYKWQGLDRSARKDYDAAIAAYSRAIALDPDHARYHYLLAKAYGQKPKDSKGVNQRGYIQNLKRAAQLPTRVDELDRSALEELRQALSYDIAESLFLAAGLLLVAILIGSQFVASEERTQASWVLSVALAGLMSGALIGIVQRLALGGWGYACGWLPILILCAVGAAAGTLMGWIFPFVAAGSRFVLAEFLIFVTPLVVVLVACFPLIRRFVALPPMFAGD